jgi:hypothetical protein
MNRKKNFLDVKSSEELLDYVLNHRLEFNEFVKFMELDDERAIKAYLHKNCLSAEEEIHFLQTAKLCYMGVYFAENALSYKGQEFLMTKCKPEVVEEYVRYHDLIEAFEYLLFQEGLEKAAHFYVVNNNLFARSEIPMMKFGGVRMLERYIEHDDLRKEAEFMLLEEPYRKLVPLYLSKWNMCPEVERKYRSQVG